MRSAISAGLLSNSTNRGRKLGHRRKQYSGLFFRDPLRFSDLNHAIKRDPRTGLRSAQNNWDFWTLLPEALHQVTIVMSDRGIPKSFRQMHGFGSHTFSMLNAENERLWVKFHFRSQQGIENLTDEAAAALWQMIGRAMAEIYWRQSNGKIFRVGRSSSR